MVVPSNDVLNERYINMKEQNEKEHQALFKKLNSMDMKMDNLVNKLEVKFASKRVERVVK
jgi:hypothetical protein